MPDVRNNQRSVPAKIIRGGSSKGVYFDVRDLPEPGTERDAQILRIYGSPDKRQIDGLGGAEKLTSKVAVMGPPAREDCDVDYLFGQVSIEQPLIDWTANCGNISAGAALYGALMGRGQVENDVAYVNVHQVNTGRRIWAQVPMVDGAPAVDGDFAISGVPGTGAPISLDFSDFAGSAMGKGLFPTGALQDHFDVPGIGPVTASIVDITNLFFFVRARDLGFDTEQPFETVSALPDLLHRIAVVRRWIAEAIGFGSGSALDTRLSISVSPQVAVLHEPIDYIALDGSPVSRDGFDLYARATNFSMHKAYPGSGSIATAVAAGVAGTLTYDVATLKPEVGEPYECRIGHPSGILTVQAQVEASGDRVNVARAEVIRTARLLMDGTAFFV